jgi:hypothetical protein
MAAMILFIASLIIGSVLWAALALFVMLLFFPAGQQLAVIVPDVPLTEFPGALAHGEVMLTTEVPV